MIKLKFRTIVNNRRSNANVEVVEEGLAVPIARFCGSFDVIFLRGINPTVNRGEERAGAAS